MPEPPDADHRNTEFQPRDTRQKRIFHHGKLELILETSEHDQSQYLRSGDGRTDWYGGPFFEFLNFVRLDRSTQQTVLKDEIALVREHSPAGITCKDREGKTVFGQEHDRVVSRYLLRSGEYILAQDIPDGPWVLYSREGARFVFGHPCNVLCMVTADSDEFTFDTKDEWTYEEVNEIEGKIYLVCKGKAEEDAPQRLYITTEGLAMIGHLTAREGRLPNGNKITEYVYVISDECEYEIDPVTDPTYKRIKQWLQEDGKNFAPLPTKAVNLVAGTSTLSKAESVFGMDAHAILPYLAPLMQNYQALIKWMDLINDLPPTAYTLDSSIKAVQEGVMPVKKRFQTMVDHGREKESITLDEILECIKIDEKDYDIIMRIGRGALKRAYLAQNKRSKGESVLLMIDPQSKGFDLYTKLFPDLGVEDILDRIYTQEFQAVELRNLPDKNFIALYTGPFKGKDGKRAVYFLETQPYVKTLEDELKDGSLDPKRALKYFSQMVYALRNCGVEGIVHKDLKPDNIGIDKRGNILLTDFGCLTKFSTVQGKEYQYPTDLRPPEMVPGTAYYDPREAFTPAGNLWTAAAIFYRMLTGKHLIERPEKRAPITSEEYHEQNEAMYEQIRELAADHVLRQNIFDEIRAYNGEAGTAMGARFFGKFFQPNPERRTGGLEYIKTISRFAMGEFDGRV